MHELKTQKWVNQNHLSELIMHIITILVFSMSDRIQPLKMQVQTHHYQITWKKRTLENGQLAHKAWSFRNQVKVKKIRWPRLARRISLKNCVKS